MSQIGLFYGTQTGNTQTIAETIQKEFGGDGAVTLHDVADADIPLLSLSLNKICTA